MWAHEGVCWAIFLRKCCLLFLRLRVWKCVVQIDRRMDIGVAPVSAYAVKRKGQAMGRKNARKAKKGKALDSKNNAETTEEEVEAEEAGTSPKKKLRKEEDVVIKDAGKG